MFLTCLTLPITMDKLAKLKQLIKTKKSVIVAFSGGLDSTVIAKICYDVLKEKAIAITLTSETYTKEELRNAKKSAKEIGIRHLIIKSNELKNKNFIANPENRCYYCKSELAKELRKIAEKEGIETIVDGVNYSDLKEHRPGIIACNEFGFFHPFVELKITKDEVREIAKELNLDYEKPSLACLSSRLPYGEKITKEKLVKIGKAEEFLRKLGFKQIRVRYHKNIARIEVFENEIEKFFDSDLRKKVVKKLKSLGFVYVVVDLQGYRSGSMDEVLGK